MPDFLLIVVILHCNLYCNGKTLLCYKQNDSTVIVFIYYIMLNLGTCVFQFVVRDCS